MAEKKIKCFPFLYNVLKGQVLSPVKVCEESEVATNIQLYETKQMSFTIKLYLKNDTALTNTFFITIFKDIHYKVMSVDRCCYLITESLK